MAVSRSAAPAADVRVQERQPDARRNLVLVSEFLQDPSEDLFEVRQDDGYDVTRHIEPHAMESSPDRAGNRQDRGLIETDDCSTCGKRTTRRTAGLADGLCPSVVRPWRSTTYAVSRVVHPQRLE